MRSPFIGSCVLMVTATAVVCFAIPANRVISVGDDVSAVRAAEIYGYSKSLFCLSSKAAGFQTPMTPVAFCLGGGWHLLVWHDDRVRRLVHFQYVDCGRNRYGDWIHTREVQSFDVSRPSLLFYFVGLAFLFGMGWATYRSRRVYRVVTVILLSLVVLGNLLVGGLAEFVAMFPIVVSIGWVAAFLVGANIIPSTSAVVSSPRNRSRGVCHSERSEESHPRDNSMRDSSLRSE
jgi:hypothetical protein